MDGQGALPPCYRAPPCYRKDMGRAPLIGLTMSITVPEKRTDKKTKSTIGRKPERVYLNSAYINAVQEAGGVPVPLPPRLDVVAQRELFARLDGILLTGGADVDPQRFNETPHPTVYDVSPARDELEVRLVEHSLDRDLPLLAICRGIQVLNVALGGTLHQDVKSAPGTDIEHSQKRGRHRTSHPVRIEAGSRLAKVIGAYELEVNSFHHQAIKELGRGLRAVAFAPDHLIEGAEIGDPERFVLGVQWHPEELASHHETARRLFRALVEAATSRSR
jgi:putative glutamine amidotransferase